MKGGIKMNNHKRIRELEDKAIEEYLKVVVWTAIIEMLTDDEQEEYWRLLNESCGF